MTKREWNIIKKVLQPNKPELSKFAIVGGYYYASDGYRLVRCEEGVYPILDEIDIPVFIDNEKHPNYLRYMEKANKMEYKAIEIPYTTKQIKQWADENYNKHYLKTPFKLGTAQNHVCIAINPYYLIDAMETCKVNTVYVPNKYGEPILVSGNDYTWLIMPVALQGFERDKTMTEICKEG